jgi:hypothetical protein
MRGSLDFLRRTTKHTKNVTDGWQLCHVALAAVRELESKVWIDSFRKVNLHPHYRVSFPEWCKRIAHHLQGGLSFKPEEVIDPYVMLPAFWHGMLPAEKMVALTIFENHEYSFTVACVRAFHSKMHIPLDDMQNLRICLQLAMENPSHLGRGLPVKAATLQPQEVVAATAGLKSINDGLQSFMLHPKGADGKQLYSGAAKFEHLTKLVRRSTPEGSALTPARYLDVHLNGLHDERHRAANNWRSREAGVPSPLPTASPALP